MSFKRYLKESEGTLLDRDELIEGIEKNCKEALRRFRRGEILYRGMNPSYGEMGKLDIRQDRKPRSSSPFEHSLFEAILRTLKLTSRQKILFASTIPANVQDYGTEYVVLPTDKWSFYYFPEIQDMTLNFPDSMGLFTDENKKKMMNDFKKLKKPQDVLGLFLEYVDKDENYQKLLTQDPRHKKENLMKMFETKIQMFIDTYKKPVTKGSLLDSGGNEISISGKSYYYFRDGLLGDYGKTLLDK